MDTNIGSLTQKETAVLQLLHAGHGAKSTAQKLGLSVHTVNERLREARRKLGVTSSREAARILVECTQKSPKLLGDKQLGVVPHPTIGHFPNNRENSAIFSRALWLAGGMLVMSVVIAGLAAATMSNVPVVSLSTEEQASPLFLHPVGQSLGGTVDGTIAGSPGGSMPAAAAQVDLMPFADGNDDQVVTFEEYETFSQFTWGIVAEGAEEIRMSELDADRLMGVIGIMPNADGMITRRMYMAAVPSRFAMLDMDGDDRLSAEELNGTHYQSKALAYMQ